MLTHDKKRVGLINWSGHGNLGDDAMASVLAEKLRDELDVINLGENVYGYTDLDAYIVGGGTLISNGSIYFDLIGQVGAEKCYGLSLGVSNEWNGTGKDYLNRMRTIFVRDLFSREVLAFYEVNSRLSVDLSCAYEIPERTNLDWIAVNFLKPRIPQRTFLPQAVDKRMETINNLSGKEPVFWVAMSPVEDMKTMGENAVLYDRYDDLLKLFAKCKTVHATRLHAVIAAWYAGVRDIRPIFYDMKIIHFLEHVANMTREEAHQKILRDIDFIKHDIIGRDNTDAKAGGSDKLAD